MDDFFFTNCKDDGAIKDKGDKSWTQYRLDLMADAAKTLIVNPAKAVNPKVKVIVKYPNWYEHFQGLGFNLEKEPAISDGIYTGTETRDAVMTSHQSFAGELRKPRMSYIEKNKGEKNVYSVSLKPHSFRIFKIE